MACPSELQQSQKPNKPGAAATGASGHNRAEDNPPQGAQVNHLQWWVELVMANPGMIR